MTSAFQYDSYLPYSAEQAYDPYAPPTPSSAAIAQILHLQIPFVLAPNGSFGTVTQDTLADVEQSIEMICGSVQGERTVVPTFGLPLQNFQIPNPQQITQIVNTLEPRAVTTISVAQNSPGSYNVTIGVTLARETAS